jgi:glutamyl-tRNA synthetase
MKPVLEGVAPWTEEALHEKLMAAIAESGMKNGQVLWPLRVAISGQASTPGGAIEIAYLLGRDETLSRLDRSIALLEGA